jgi:hypothetical protein
VAFSQHLNFNIRTSPLENISKIMKRTSMFIPDWSAVIIKLKRGPTTRVEEKGDELLMKTTVKLAKGKSLFHFPENFLNNKWLKLWLSPKIYLMRLENAKEIVRRRHGEPIKFLSLPKMGLLGSQACNKKNCWL